MFPGSEHSEKLTFMDSDMPSRMAQISSFYSLTLTLIFKLHILAFFFYADISQTVRDKENITVAIK